MKLKKATIKDFRRFKHLTVRSIPETARLIIDFRPERLWEVFLFRCNSDMA